MACFTVSFIKDNVIGEDGRCRSVLQRVVKVEARDQDEAFRKAQQAFIRSERISDWHVHADRVEIGAPPPKPGARPRFWSISAAAGSTIRTRPSTEENG
jgi:hypothetical protein